MKTCSKTKGFEKRAQYYAAKAYIKQANKGEEYHNLKEVIFIAIADFILFPNKQAYKSDHVTLDKITYENDLKDFSFTFVELPKFKKTKEDQLENIVEKWIYFFKYANETSEEDLQKIIGSDVIIGRAYNELDQFNWTEDRRLAYDQSKKRTDDYHSTLSQKFNEGIKIGEERDKAEGIAEGGKQAKIEVAKNLLEDNVPIDVIYRTTGLPIDKIKELASQE
uniref:Rpn family recombination-promoting nuclease/putative transposase n=1 Tax=Wolbachia endosymbiont of Drosophila pseudotakahashii TaxID=375919 RepID=UPI0038783FF4